MRWTALASGGGGLALVALGWLAMGERPPAPAPRAEPSVRSAEPAPRSARDAGSPKLGEPGWLDPLAPRRPSTIRGPLDAGWHALRPARQHQYSRSAAERRVLPCEAPDPGFGVHADWVHTRPMGQYIAPRGDFLAEDGGFDMVVHFHGHRPARKELVRTGEDLVLLGVSKGPGAAYGPDFSDPELMQGLVAQVERGLSRRVGRPAKLRRLALSSWSRGYEAIEAILRQPIAAKVQALVLIDSLHCSRTPSRAAEQLEPFVAFARRAACGEVFLFASHSSIDTPDYASSTEAVHRLVRAIGGVPRHAARRDPLGLELVELYSAGDFHARGYAGNGKLDHCAHFGLYADAISAIARRWSSR